MIITNRKELSVLRECGSRLAEITQEVARSATPGVSTQDLDRLAETLITKAGGLPVFKGYRAYPNDPAYPACICTSVNEEVVHAIPRSDRILKEGDVLGIDIAMRYPEDDGFITDMAVVQPVGAISTIARELSHITYGALEVGIHMVRAGVRMGDLGNVIQRHIEENGFHVVRELLGHGVGKHLHENPQVPNYGIPGTGVFLREGMVFAIEPMATVGDPSVVLDRDGWTWRTRDGSLAAHWEHTVVVTKNGAEILTKI